MDLYWLSRKLDDVPKQDDWLSAAERAVAAGKKFSKRRDDWQLGRWTAKQAVRGYLLSVMQLPCEPRRGDKRIVLGVSPGLAGGEDRALEGRQTSDLPGLASLEIRAAPDGAPEPYLQNQPLPVSLAISHSAGMSFCVVGPPDSAAGCDLELIRPLVSNFAEDYFVAAEAALLGNLSRDEREAYTLLIWSAKESALKSLREGLRRDTRSLVVSFDRSQAASGWSPLLVNCTMTSRTFYGWWQIAGGYVRTITAAPPITHPVEIQLP